MSDKIKPNILLIMSDDHAAHAISSYGSVINETPHIDRVAEEGILFRNAFVTNSICAPSRAVILTGKYSHLNGVKDNHTPFDSSQVTFPKILRENGYETAIVGKWHLRSQPAGFDYWNVLPGQGDYYNPGFINNGKDTVYEGYVTDIITRLGLEWLSSRESDRPFLLMVHHKAPHRNWMPHIKNLDVYEDAQFHVPISFWDDYRGREHLHDQELTVAHHLDMVYDLKIPCDTCEVVRANRWARESYQRNIGRLSPAQREAWEQGYEEEIAEFAGSEFSAREEAEWKLKRYLQDYLRSILSVDESVGRILDYLEDHGLSENTVVIYTSDQGFFLGEHGLFDKRYMYEESMRTPLVMKYPARIREGMESNALVQNLDLAPTILDMAGIEIPDFFQGVSLLPLFDTPDPEKWREAVYYQFYEEGWGVPEHHGIRTRDYKLIYFSSDPASWELYDIRSDPHEMDNLYDDEAYGEIVVELKNEMGRLQSVYYIQPE